MPKLSVNLKLMKAILKLSLIIEDYRFQYYLSSNIVTRNRKIVFKNRGCGKTQNVGTWNSGIWNNKSRMVKRGTTCLVRLNADYLHLNFNIFQYKSDRIHIFTPAERFSNRYWYGQGNYLSHDILLNSFIYLLIFIYLFI